MLPTVASLHTLLLATAAFVGVTALALGIRQLALRAVHRRVVSPWMDRVVVRSLRLPSLLWCLLIGLYIGLDVASLPPRPTHVILNVVYSLLVISVTAAVANLCSAMLREGLAQAHLAIPATGVSVAFISVTIWIVGGLVLLSGLGISVTPVLTALGVGGLAVALALQDTLSNFFAGLHLLIERPIRVGDFVKLESGQEGHVVDIGWRTTRIRMPPNNMVILPNSKLTQSVVTNYSLPDPETTMLIPISVSYTTEPDHIERVLLEETRKAMGHVPGLLAVPEPSVRLIPGFGTSSLDFTLACRVRDVDDQALVQHELRKRILKRFRAESIQMAVPQQVVQIQGLAGAPPKSPESGSA
jgi:small-conductance mechanosensitive channel